MPKREPVVAHNLTAKQLQEVQYDQQSDNLEKMSGNRDSEYIFPAIEKHLVHVRTYVPQFNPTTGKDEGIRNTQSFYPPEFAKMVKEQAFAGAKVEILHDPADDAEDVSEKASLTPQITSVGAGAGVPLTEALQAKDKRKIWDVYKSFNQDVTEEQYEGISRDKMVAEITEKANFLNEEAKTEEYAQIEINRLRTAGYVLQVAAPVS